MKLVWALLIGLGLSAQGATVQEALVVLGKSKAKHWHYRLTEQGEINRVSRHDPDAEPAWVLESLEGKLPSAEQLAQFSESKKPKSGKGIKLELSEMVDMASLKAEDSGPNPKRYTFNIKEGSVPEFDADDFAGRLTLDDKGDVQIFELYNKDSFRVKLIAKIEKFNMQFDFARQAGGYLLPTSMRTEMHGSLGGVKRLDEVKVNRYSDYRPGKQILAQR